MNLSRIRATLWKLRYILLAVAVLTSLAAVLSTTRELAPVTVSVIVVKKDLTSGTTLGSPNLTTAEVPAELVPEGLTRSPEDLNERILVISVLRGTPVTRKMTLSDGFLASVPEGTEIAPTIADVGGVDKLLTLGRIVTLYVSSGEYSKAREVMKIVDKVAIVGVGPKDESTSFASDSSYTSVLYAAASQDTIDLVIGHGSTMPMRAVVVR